MYSDRRCGIQKRIRAFTLIELLVVIAIISIIAAILFPVFATAREKARQSTCASNEKQIGFGFLQYTQDYDERLPITGSTSSAWDVCIQPYMGVQVMAHTTTGAGINPTIFACPDDLVVRTSAAKSPRSYAMARPGGNYTGMGGLSNGCGTDMGCLPISQVPSPSQTFLILESPNAGNYFGNNSGSIVDRPEFYSSTCPGWASPSPGSPAGTCYNSESLSMNGVTLHSGGYNYLYGDGHVKWMNPDASYGTGTSNNPKGAWTIADGD